MPNSAGSPPSAVSRVVYKEIVPGDLRKFKAESNDAPSGGGARDLRFRPYRNFGSVFERLFPQKRTVRRRRNRVDTNVDVLVGRFFWKDGAIDRNMEAVFEPPTTARPGEGRLAVVHNYPPLQHAPSFDDGRVVVMLVQRQDGTVWPAFATEGSLRRGEWDAAVARAVLSCLDAKRGKSQIARGFIDFELHEHYCDA